MAYLPAASGFFSLCQQFCQQHDFPEWKRCICGFGNREKIAPRLRKRIHVNALEGSGPAGPPARPNSLPPLWHWAGDREPSRKAGRSLSVSVGKLKEAALHEGLQRSLSPLRQSARNAALTYGMRTEQDPSSIGRF